MAKSKIYILIILIGIIFVGIAAVTFRYQSEISTDRQKLESLGSQVVERDCSSIEYAQIGDGYPVFIIHGALGGFDQGLLTAKAIIEAGYQAISISRFGYLRSPIPHNATLDMQVDAYACLLDSLGIQQVAVLASSGGATSAIRFAARYPTRISALILVSPAAPGDVMAAPPPKIVLDLMRSDFFYWMMVTYLRPLIQKMIGVPEGFAVTSENDEEITKLLDTTLPSSTRIDGFNNDFHFMNFEFFEEISVTNPYSVYKIEIPVLVFNALDDPLALPVNVRNLTEKFPNASLITVNDGGHLLLGYSETVRANMLKFLQSHAP